jgi:hypothetical protein
VYTPAQEAAGKITGAFTRTPMQYSGWPIEIIEIRYWQNNMTRTKSKKQGVPNGGKRFYFAVDKMAVGTGEQPKTRQQKSKPVRMARAEFTRQAMHVGRTRIARDTGGGTIGMVPTEMGNANSGSLHSQRVEQDEVIGIISGSGPGAFQSTPFQINPGQLATFPWLGQLALLFERYEIRELEYYYKPIVSGYAPSGQIGKVILSTDYDAASAALQNYRQAETMDPHADGMPYENIVLRLDPRRLTPPGGKFVRTGILPAGNDIKTFDAGTFYASVQGTTDTNQIGELRVRYVIALMNPRLPNTNPPSAQFTASGVYASAAVAAPAGTPTLALLNTLTSNPSNGLGVALPGGGLVALHAGLYSIAYQGVWTVSTGQASSLFTELLVNGAAVGGRSVLTSAGTNSLSSSYQSGTTVYQAQEGDTLSLSGLCALGGGTATFAGYLWITAV